MQIVMSSYDSNGTRLLWTPYNRCALNFVQSIIIYATISRIHISLVLRLN